jgi:hypothetical protein
MIHKHHIDVSGFAPPPLYCGGLLAAVLFSHRDRQILENVTAEENLFAISAAELSRTALYEDAGQ